MLETVKNILWSPATVVLIAMVGIVLSIKTSFRALKNPIKTLKETIFSIRKNSSSFEAMCTALGGTIGVGNTIGVACAIAEGGPGALFWMFAASLFGMVIKETEIFLSMKFKPLDTEFSGPMYYIEKGIGNKLFAKIWAFSCILTSFGMGNFSQSMAAVDSVDSVLDIKREYISVFITVIVVITVSLGLGGIKKCIGKCIPFATVTYILLTLIILFINRNNIPNAIASVFKSAFNVRSGAVGIKWSVFAAAVQSGFSRGIFTNEAGLGSACIIHSSSEEVSPEKQAKWGVVEVFIDTSVICMLTGLMILTSNIKSIPSEKLTQEIFISFLGRIGGVYYAVSMLIFALASIIAWYCYAECALKYLGKESKLFKYLFAFATFLGGIIGANDILMISDIFNAVMLITNLAALLLLSNEAKSN